MFKCHNKENVFEKKYQWPLQDHKSPLQQRSYSIINKIHLSNEINKSFNLSINKRFNYDNNKSLQKSRIQIRNQSFINKSGILKNKIQNQDRNRNKLIEQFEAVHQFDQKPLNIDTKNKYVKLKDQKNGNIMLNYDFMRLQQIRKENQKKMLELGLQPKKIYQAYYKKHELEKVMENQQRKQIRHQRYSRNVFQNNQPKQIRKSFMQKEKYQQLITPIRNIVNQANKFSDDFKNSYYQKQLNISNNEFKKQNNIQNGIQKFRFQQHHKRRVYSQNKQPSIRHKNFKNYNKTNAHLNDQRIKSIDRITSKIKNLLKTIQKTQNLDNSYYNKNKFIKVYDKNKNNYQNDQEKKQYYDKPYYQKQIRKYCENEQRNKKIKELEMQRESKFEQWKNKVQNQNKTDTTPMFKSYKQQQFNQEWDDDVKRIAQKIQNFQQQKQKMQKQSQLINLNNGSRVTLNISRFSNTSKKIYSKALQQKKKTINSLAQLFNEQIIFDNKFRQQKSLFSICNNVNKWDTLKQQLTSKNILLTQQQIHNIFTYSFQESNPFLESNNDIIDISNLVKKYEQTNNFFKNNIVGCRTKNVMLNIKNEFTKEDIIQIQDLVRFVNMQLNTFYRNRDLILFYRRFGEERLTYKNFLDILSKKQ